MQNTYLVIKDVVEKLRTDTSKEIIMQDIADKLSISLAEVELHLKDKQIIKEYDNQGDGSCYYVIADKKIIDEVAYWHYDDAYGNEVLWQEK